MRPTATIFKTVHADHVRHTVIVCYADATKNRRFTRQVFGARADWQEITEEQWLTIDTRTSANASVTVTDADLRDLENLPKPTTLLQKLVRAVEGKNSSKPAPAPSALTPAHIDRLQAYASAVAPIVAEPVNAMASVPSAVVLTPVVDTEQVEFLAERANTPLEQSLDASGKPLPIQSQTATHEEYAILEVPTAKTKGVLGYIGRSIHGLPEDNAYSLAQNLSQSICINGGAGTGKTSSARVQAYKRAVPFVQFECTPATTIAEVIGRFVATKDKGVALWRHSELVTAIQQESVVLLNELTRMSPRSASYFLRLLEEREVYIPELGRVIKVHPKCILVADMNTGYRGTQNQDEALLSRFNHKWEFDYDRDIEKNFIPSESLLDLATRLRTAYTEKRLHTPFTTRMLNNFVSQVPASFSYAVGMLVNCYPAGEERKAVLDAMYTFADSIAKELGVPVGDFVIPDIEAPQSPQA